MGDVFANGLEISGKAVKAQTIAAFPDVCMTPPENPATPPGVPIPYPNFALAGDTENGTSTVKIKGKTVNLKNKSDMKKTSGDEAGCAAKKGVITSKNMGKSYFNSWSMNVKFEGAPVVRMSDLTTNNHASPIGNTPPWPHMAGVDLPDAIVADENCIVGEYNIIAKKCNEGGGEAHHIVPDKVFRTGTRAEAGDAAKRIDNSPTLKSGMAICLKPEDHTKIHQSEKDNLKALGKPGLEGLSGKALTDAKDALKAKGEYGTAKVSDIYEAANQMLDGLLPSDNLSEECVKMAKEAINGQGDEFDDGQIGRTSGQLPNAQARKRMIP